MKLTVQKQIPVPADAAWHVLGTRFAEVANYFSQVDVSRPITLDEVPDGYAALEGAPVPGRYTESRVIKATEVLTAYSDAEMTFTFDAVDVPAALLSVSRNTTRVVAVGPDMSQVTITVEMGLRHVFNLLAPVLRKRMTRLFTRLIEEVEAAAR